MDATIPGIDHGNPGCATPSLRDGLEMIDAAVLRDLAPTGTLRIALNEGNVAVVQHDIDSGQFGGIAIELSKLLVLETGLPLRYISYPSAGAVFGALNQEGWDVAFLAIDQARRAHLSFTAPYMHLEGRYLVPRDSAVSDPIQLDSPEISIGVTAGSAYDLHLERRLQSGRLVRYPTSAESLSALAGGHVDAAAGVATVLDRFVSRHAGFRILMPAFMTIDHGIAVPIARAAAAQYLSEFMGRQLAAGLPSTPLKI